MTKARDFLPDLTLSPFWKEPEPIFAQMPVIKVEEKWLITNTPLCLDLVTMTGCCNIPGSVTTTTDTVREL